MREAVGQVVKGWMAVHFIVGGLVKTFGFIGVGGMYKFTFNHPDAYAFLPARVHIARVLDGHLRIGGMQAAYVLVIQALPAADEYFPQRPRPFAGTVGNRSRMRFPGFRLFTAAAFYRIVIAVILFIE